MTEHRWCRKPRSILNGIGLEGRLDRKLESWKVGSVKTTLDLPADLIREMKMRAAHEGRKLRDVATEIFRRGLSQPAASGPIRQRVKLPLIPCAPGAPASRMTAEELIALEQETQTQEDLERLGLPL